MIHGSCLCGLVKFEISGKLYTPLNCHCSMCRKAHASAFRSRAGVKAGEFKWLMGSDKITWFESSHGNYRGFCNVCGTRLISRFDDNPDYYGVPLAIFDGQIDAKPIMHVFVGSKANWYEITDALPQYDELPQDM